MSITLDLKPEVEERLKQEAAQKGKSLEAYLLELVERPGIAAPRASGEPAAAEGLRDASGSPGEKLPVHGQRKHSLLELRGAGAHLWKDIDPQEHVDELRREWNHRP